LTIGASACALAACAKVVEVYRDFSLLPVYRAELRMQQSALEDDEERPPTPIRPASRLRSAVADIGRAPGTEYGLHGCAMRWLFPPPGQSGPPTEVALAPANSFRATADVECGEPCLLATNLMASPFFVARLNGVPVPASALRQNGRMTAIVVGAPGR